MAIYLKKGYIVTFLSVALWNEVCNSRTAAGVQHEWHAANPDMPVSCKPSPWPDRDFGDKRGTCAWKVRSSCVDHSGVFAFLCKQTMRKCSLARLPYFNRNPCSCFIHGHAKPDLYHGNPRRAFKMAAWARFRGKLSVAVSQTWKWAEVINKMVGLSASDAKLWLPAWVAQPKNGSFVPEELPGVCSNLTSSFSSPSAK